MTDLDSLRGAAIIGVALAVAVGIVTGPPYFAAFGIDLEAAVFVHPEAVPGRVTETAVLRRWGFLGDMLFTYMLLVPWRCSSTAGSGSGGHGWRTSPRRRAAYRHFTGNPVCGTSTYLRSPIYGLGFFTPVDAAADPLMTP